MPKGVYDHSILQHTYCLRGHELTKENSRQTYKNGRPNGRRCRQCGLDDHKVFREKNPEYMSRSRMNSQGRIRYGMEDYLKERDEILASQGNACAICRRTDCHWGRGFKDTWHVDHDPTKSGTHRGVLCAFCNTALGRLEKFMPQVQAYLSRHS